MFLRFAALALMAATPVAALAQDWRFVGSNEGMSDYVDVSTIRRTGSSVQFRTERRLATPFNAGGRVDLDLVLELYEADCDALTYLPLERSAYLNRQLVIPVYRPDDSVRTANRGTVIAALIEFACTSSRDI